MTASPPKMNHKDNKVNIKDNKVNFGDAKLTQIQDNKQSIKDVKIDDIKNSDVQVNQYDVQTGAAVAGNNNDVPVYVDISF